MPTDPQLADANEIDQRTLDEVALSREEYTHILELLGRAPNSVELGLFGAMWSEHCGYKNSRPLLKRFPTSGPRILVKAGEENAGAVDIGGGLAVVMKIESHNHPSAIEPYQGAATGVGGIVRDIFTMGARPIALLDSLRFGPLSEPRNRYLFSGIVGGVGGYGNCLGIPTVGGEIYFDASYNGNPLVNAMCVGLIEAGKLVPARASGPGNPVLLVGAATGRDGIHGATFASVELDEASEERRPAVQVGDPFTEKLLMEACLELRDKGWIVGMQDLGAAGLTSSSVESAHKGESGIDLDVLKAPRREAGITPYEMMLSESQERMLVVAKAGHEEDVQRLFARWGLRSDVIGNVVAEQVIRVREGAQVVAEVPTRLLTDETPSYTRDGVQPPELTELWGRDLAPLLQDLPAPAEILLQLLASPDLCSREDVYRTYDTMLGTNTVIGPGSDAAVLRVRDADDRETGKYLALTTDGNGRLTYLDPYNGGALAVAEAARNIVCSGAEPLALTNCLNFGNPEKLGVYYQLEQAIDGMAAAARTLETPVISGNVSLYNESYGAAIYPTPVVGMVGLIDGRTPTPSAFQAEGDIVGLLGPWRADVSDLGGSTLLATLCDTVAGRPPRLDLEQEQALQRLMLDAIAAGLIRSAHDCSDGGLAVALAECSLWSGLGLRSEFALPESEANGHDSTLAMLFGEAPSRIVVSVAPEQWEALATLATERGLPLTRLGTVGGDTLHLDSLFDVPVRELHTTWRDGLRVTRQTTEVEQAPGVSEEPLEAPETPEDKTDGVDQSPEELREQLVAKLVRESVLRDPEVERALRAVPRNLFLPEVPVALAYSDNAIPTHWEDGKAVSSASQPAIVAIMLQQLQVQSGMHVLEVGAGTGYNAALLSELVGADGAVTTIDIDAEIADEARAHLAAAGYPQVRVLAGDGSAGWPEGAPYDRIELTVGAYDVSPAWFEQLAEDGLLVLPLWLGTSDASIAFRKHDDTLHSESLAPCGFMRLRGVEASGADWVPLPGGRILGGERAKELMQPVTELLSMRPRRRIWTRRDPTFFQWLGLGGHAVVALGVNPGKRRHAAIRIGLYADGDDGPSLSLFAARLPLLLSFGGKSAERILDAASAEWQRAKLLPLDQWHIIAYPRAGNELRASSGLHLIRRHFVFGIEATPSPSHGNAN